VAYCHIGMVQRGSGNGVFVCLRMCVCVCVRVCVGVHVCRRGCLWSGTQVGAVVLVLVVCVCVCVCVLVEWWCAGGCWCA
jgi:hypothetical protein